MATRMWPLRRGKYTTLVLGNKVYKGLSGAWVEVDSSAAVIFMQSMEWVTYDINAGADQTEIIAAPININYPVTLDDPILEPGGWALSTGEVINPLGVLTISPNFFTVGAVQGDDIGTVLGTTPGSLVIIGSLGIPNSIQVVLKFGTWEVQVGSDPPGMPESISLSLIENLIDTVNTPRTTFGLIIRATSAVGDSLNLGLNLTANSVPLMF